MNQIFVRIRIDQKAQIMEQLQGKTALVTGASSGIGRAFAFEIARAGGSLILTARSEDKLQEIARHIRQQHNVTVTVIPADLAQPGAATELMQAINAKGLAVNLLVNNAGVGKWTQFLDEPLTSYEAMVTLNITSLMALTYLVLPQMLTNGQGGIINVGSTGSFQPCPYIAAYCATKAFVLSFSEALHGEYQHRGIQITALCPGNTETGFQAEAQANTEGMRADSPETVARQGLKALRQGRSFTIVGTDNYVQSLAPRLLPRKTIINLVASMMRKKLNTES